ncbi:MAG: COX15/CtaA family protein [Gemmatimonadota bacterium]|nr:COX15/CtaA family protein [Gemmatimonadota bacterium]
MHIIRRISLAALALAFAHLVFGGIVRITGSGMGCGDHWPKCHGEWFPPLERPDLIIELGHRYLAVLLIGSLVALAGAAWHRRTERGVGGRGGVLRSAIAAVVVVVLTALLGALTVFLGNPTSATVGHWTLAMALLALVAATAIRAGALGGTHARHEGAVSSRTSRAALVAAALAFGAVALGGVTAKYPSAAVACPSFPLCGTNPDAVAGASHVQLTHRALAFLLVFHLFGVAIALTRRGENAVVTRAALAALGLTAVQIAIAAAMIGFGLPPIPRALHQAVGVGVWLSTFVFYYLTRTARAAPAHVVPARSLTADVAVAAAERA